MNDDSGEYIQSMDENIAKNLILYGISALIFGGVMYWYEQKTYYDYCIALKLTDYCILSVRSFSIIVIGIGVILTVIGVISIKKR